ncbi:unnamed protein product [Blepharisma stoltei]|uniref:Maturase K n=1 Tax=Blepharisma stoltei TaxID=1481888 RepID=A0AAU9ICG0_9CILI|nr:unnamed protein product [Blepharisma stoltei]
MYFGSDMFYDEFMEIKRVLLLQDSRIRKALDRLIGEKKEIFRFKGLFELDHLRLLADSQVNLVSLPRLKKLHGSRYP